MRYLYACFSNYIGFYNGMGIRKLEIDFRKCQNHIILISGMNGSGKSTLLNALSPFPDSSTSFIPNLDGEKRLIIFENGDTYEILILSPSDTKGGRKQTKAFIKKNGQELNENGNITSYKDIIFSEFDLDSNYLSLTKLSSNDRGLGDKKPAERKKFASNIIDNLETYNEIYKTLNKKSLIFKSHISNLHTKIQNIGTMDGLKMRLRSLEERNNVIQNEIYQLTAKTIEINTRASINQEEAQKMEKLLGEKKELESQISELYTKIKLFQKSLEIVPEDLNQKYDSDLSLLEGYKSKRDQYHMQWIADSEKLSAISKKIHELEINLETYCSNIDESLKERYESSLQTVQSLKNRIQKLGFEPNTDLLLALSKLLDFLQKFTQKLNNFYSGDLTPKDLEILANYNIKYTEELRNSLNQQTNALQLLNIEIDQYNDKLRTISILENRPSNCKIDTCPFIANAVKLEKEISGEELIALIEDGQRKQKELSDSINQTMEQITHYTFFDEKFRELQNILSELEENRTRLIMFQVKDLIDTKTFLNHIACNYNFYPEREPKSLIDLYNYLSELESENKSFFVLQAQYEAMQNKIQLIESTKKSIEENKMEEEELTRIVYSEKKNHSSYSDFCTNLETKISQEKEYLSVYSSYLSLSQSLKEIEQEIKEMEIKSYESLQSVMKLNDLKQEIQRLTTEANPIIEEMQKLSGQLTLLESYYQEYQEYNVKYDMIEKIKKYCSPTGGGIQTIFMQLYMSKTWELSNQILGMLFGGEYQLLEFVINQNEFRIPFIGSGLEVDDISSGSTSQICIMGMVINLVLFYQASTKFNIARLDEIDGGLDHRNRFEFVNALYRIISILNIEQLFIISHSIETDTSSVDIIKLKGYPDYDDSSQLGNIIYDYSKEMDETNK